MLKRHYGSILRSGGYFRLLPSREFWSRWQLLMIYTVVRRSAGSCGAAETSGGWSQGIEIGSSPPMSSCLPNRVRKSGRYWLSCQ